MALPDLHMLVIEQGATFHELWAIEDHNTGEAIDLAQEGNGYTSGTLRVRDAYGGQEIITLNTDNGGVVIGLQTGTDGHVWSGYFYIPASETSDMTQWGEGVFDFHITDGSDVVRVFQGPAVLSRGVQYD